MTKHDDAQAVAAVGSPLEPTVRRLPLLTRLDRLGNKGGVYRPLLREAAAALRAAEDRFALAEARPFGARHECEWCVDDDGVWYTGCGHAWQFEDGGPKENSAKFCQYCGGRLTEAPNASLSGCTQSARNDS